MAATPSAGEPRPWHQALAYAVTGRAWPELGQQSGPDLVELASRLRAVEGEEGLRQHVRMTLQGEEPWPHSVPAELRAGLGYAQFAAALNQLRSELRLDGPTVVANPGERTGPVSAAERRLLDDVPPHHGS